MFEVSWEICNKVGGIYTVVKSKVQPTQENYENYFLVGPYFPKKAFGTFEEQAPPDEFKGAFDELKSQGIELHFGQWLVSGSPKTILVDFSRFAERKNSIKKDLWDWYQIDTLNTEWFDFDEPIVWATAVGRVIQKLKEVEADKRIVAHFHEWLAGAGLLYLRHENVKVGTVFTTHATTLGRALATRDVDIYSDIKSIDAGKRARELGPSFFAKHLLESRTAKNAHVFTTVSEITGIEAEHFLGRKPDVLLFNGLNMDKFPSFEEASLKHDLFKNRMKEFIMYHFFPYYSFDLDKTLIYFVAGRYEFRDKGIDVFIKALQKLNDKFKEEKCDKRIVTFFFVPGAAKGIRPELLQNKMHFMDVFDSMEDSKDDIHSKLIQLLVTGNGVDKSSLLSEELREDLKPKLKRLKRKGMPPLSTHELENEGSDQIMRALRDAGLDNSEDDVVKVVFYPIYLSGADGLLDTSYYESMQGSHLGVFPSFYEPWGYTPLEAAALGVSSITTDLAGFGRYLCKECEQPKYPGIFVLQREKKSDEEIVDALCKMMSDFAHFSAKERTSNKITAQRLAATADWKVFIENYVEAHNKAVDSLK